MIIFVFTTGTLISLQLGFSHFADLWPPKVKNEFVWFPNLTSSGRMEANSDMRSIVAYTTYQASQSQNFVITHSLLCLEKSICRLSSKSMQKLLQICTTLPKSHKSQPETLGLWHFLFFNELRSVLVKNTTLSTLELFGNISKEIHLFVIFKVKNFCYPKGESWVMARLSWNLWLNLVLGFTIGCFSVTPTICHNYLLSIKPLF